MSVDWYVGFPEIPKQNELDSFMESIAFRKSRKASNSEFVRVYTRTGGVDREITFFYGPHQEQHIAKPNHAIVIMTMGALTTYDCAKTYEDPKDRMKAIADKSVKTEHQYYTHIAPERLEWYHAALALQKRFGAWVWSAQTNQEINPQRPFPDHDLKSDSLIRILGQE